MSSRPTSAALGCLELSREELERCVLELGGRPAHARRLRRFVLRGGQSLEAYDDPRAELPQGLAAALQERGLVALRTRCARSEASADGSTKLAVQLADGQSVECVFMPGRHSHAVCVSTQVGCAVGCVFCASGLGGLVRNLEPYEILEQVAHASTLGPFQRIVVMGIGEPLHNLDALLAALDVVVEELALPESRITVSTVGAPERIERLRASGRRFRLAISLHAAEDSLRARLMPAVRQAPLRDVVAAARRYAEHAGGRIQFEYVVLPGVNDRVEQLAPLVDLLHGMPAFLNLIPWNPVPELPFARPADDRLYTLMRWSRDHGLFATCRLSKGATVEAACGQLRRGLAAGA